MRWHKQIYDPMQKNLNNFTKNFETKKKNKTKKKKNTEMPNW